MLLPDGAEAGRRRPRARDRRRLDLRAPDREGDGRARGRHVLLDEKLERARTLGADHTINYRRTENWAASFLERTSGRGADHVIEVGGPGTLPQSIEACRIGGHISLIGVVTGIGGEVPTATLMRRQQRLQGLIVGSRKHQEDFVRALDALPIRPVIDRTYPLAEMADAFRYQMSAGHFGKICLEI